MMEMLVMTKATNAKPLSTHDRKVRELARDLEKQGFKVRADLQGREKPRPITSKGLVPDIEAERAGRKLIVEIETPESHVRDKAQIETFVRHAAHKGNTTFRLVVTKPRKK